MTSALSHTTVYLSRHGQTLSNLVECYAGWTNEGLTETGRKQILALAARLRGRGLAEVWSSQIPRAVESAHIVGRALGCNVRCDSRLNELAMGPWEGLTETEVAERYPNEYRLWLEHPDRLILTGRETLSAVADRICAVLSDAQEHLPVLLMSHVAPIRVALLVSLGVPLARYKLVSVSNADCFTLGASPRSVRRLDSHESVATELGVVERTHASS